MKKPRIAPFAAGLAAAAGAGLLLCACSGDMDVSRAIGRLYSEPGARTIRLADATRFAWDQVYLFNPYTQRSQVCATLRIPDRDCERRISFDDQDDGVMTLAFLDRGRLVRYAPHLRKNGDFAPVPKAQPLSPRSAVFQIVHERTGPGYPAPKLRLATPD